MCIDFVSYFVIVTKEPVGPMVPGRGLRHGDPLPPNLFILCSKGLTFLINHAIARRDIHGIDICRGAPTITHLLFVYDCFLFLRSSSREVDHMKVILNVYEKASGQQINFKKSKVFFSKNVPQVDRDNVANLPGVHVVLGIGLYLGLPSMIGGVRRQYSSLSRIEFGRR